MDRGEITSHMGGRSAATVMLQRIRRLIRLLPHLSSVPMAGLSEGGGAADVGSCGSNCTGVWIGARGGGGGEPVFQVLP